MIRISDVLMITRRLMIIEQFNCIFPISGQTEIHALVNQVFL